MRPISIGYQLLNNTHSSFFSFSSTALSVVAGGESALDQKNLHIHNLAEADAFIKGYGFDISIEADRNRLWYFHRRALVLLTERLNYKLDEIPKELRSQADLQDLRNLLLWASQSQQSSHKSSQKSASLQKWSCALLKCMHVFIHAETDLFSFYAEEIQKQILLAFQQSVVQEDKLYLRSFFKEGHPQVELLHFETKPFKTSASTVIKLLAKPDALAVKVFDKIGIRFVTKTLFDSFQVIRFLVDENLMSFPHIMPDQSSNNMYPVSDFMKVCEKLESKHGSLFKMDPLKVDRLLMKQIKSNDSWMKLFRKENPYSSKDFRYIKFISRKLIKIKNTEGAEFSFFYPFEVQILNEKSYDKMQSGDSEHSSYKSRQVEAARLRLMGS